MWLLFLSVSALICAALNIYGDYQSKLWLKYLTKPLVMVFIMLLAALSPSTLWGFKMLMLCGLLCSTAGDVFLMLPDNRFLAGLFSFLIAHLFFILAFLQKVTIELFYALFITPFMLFAMVMVYLLWSHLKTSYKIPVILYIAVISTMGWLASIWYYHQGGLSTGLAFCAALLFIISDSILAINRFRSPFSSAQFWILSTYFTSQWFFSLAVYTLA